MDHVLFIIIVSIIKLQDDFVKTVNSEYGYRKYFRSADFRQQEFTHLQLKAEDAGIHLNDLSSAVSFQKSTFGLFPPADPL